MPEDCHKAIKLALELTQKEDLGGKWSTLVDTWIRFEGTHNYTGSSKLPTTDRPPAVGDWVQRARSPKYYPDLHVDEYAISFWKWWICLQPDWRRIEQDTTLRAIGGSWKTLDKPGTNGWPSIIAGLFFWGKALGKGSDKVASWSLAVDDACWVLQQLCETRLVP